MQMVTKNIKATNLRVTCRFLILLSYIVINNFAFGQNDLLNKKPFIPDTTINSVLKLLNAGSIRRSIGDQTAKMIEDEKAVRVQLINKRGNEYLILYQLPGSSWNTFNEFEVSSIKIHHSSYKLTSFSSFSTESWVSLGMSMDSLIMIKGNRYSRLMTGDQTVLIYKLQENENDTNVSILERYNMPEYKATYYFINSRLVKFIFGFPNP
jgi:hypothetical protein